MLRHIYEISCEDHVKNEGIRSEAKVKPVSKYMCMYMRKRELQRYGHMRGGEIVRRILDMTEMRIAGRRMIRRPKRLVLQVMI